LGQTKVGKMQHGHSNTSISGQEVKYGGGLLCILTLIMVVLCSRSNPIMQFYTDYPRFYTVFRSQFLES